MQLLLHVDQSEIWKLIVMANLFITGHTADVIYNNLRLLRLYLARVRDGKNKHNWFNEMLS